MHKSLHKSNKGNHQNMCLFSSPNLQSRVATGTKYDPFSTFGYTGPLRPVYPLSPRRTVPDHIEKPDYAETGLLEIYIMCSGIVK